MTPHAPLTGKEMKRWPRILKNTPRVFYNPFVNFSEFTITLTNEEIKISFQVTESREALYTGHHDIIMMPTLIHHECGQPKDPPQGLLRMVKLDIYELQLWGKNYMMIQPRTN